MNPMLIKSYYSHPRMDLTKVQQKLLANLFQCTTVHKETGEECLGYFFFYGPYSEHPLLPILKKLQHTNKVYLVFGQYDWIDFERTISNLKKEKIEIPVSLMSKAGHQMNYQRPFELAKFVCERKNPKSGVFMCEDLEMENLKRMVDLNDFKKPEYNIIKGKGILPGEKRKFPIKF